MECPKAVSGVPEIAGAAEQADVDSVGRTGLCVGFHVVEFC